MEQIKTYTKIEKKLFEVGFDEFHQGGSKSKFRPLNIIATSKALNKQFWIAVDGGYRCADSFHITYRDLDDTKSKQIVIDCKSQMDVVDKLNEIKLNIMSAK